MKFSLLGALAAVVVGGAAVVSADKVDLPPGDSLRIGVKYKPEVCDKVATNGDKLSMHCALGAPR